MKILNWLVAFSSNTLGSWHWPWVDKRLSLKDYFKIEKAIRQLSNPFVVGVVKTNGHGSNILISIAQLFSSRNKTNRVTHALAHIGLHGGFKHRVVESVGSGIQEISLLEAIGQRDEVVLRKPNPHLINDQVCKHALEYIYAVAERDKNINIEYDNAHDYTEITIEEIRDYSNKNVNLDCSETVMQSLVHGFKMAGQKNLIKMTSRAGKLSWAPSDIYFSELFITMYDSKKGLING